MKEAPENGKESSHSAHANGMNIRIMVVVVVVVVVVVNPMLHHRLV
jgi:hypothetical protein